MDEVKVLLDMDEMPRRWYNILPDLPEQLPPPINPATKEPIGPEDLAPIFPMELIKQEVSQERYIDIPEEVVEAYYRIGRPTPLYRARRLEKALGTPARIYYKREDVSFAGSHKPNTAIAQAYYNMKEGVEKLSTETGAGQWGTALSLGCALFDLACEVFMVRVSYDQKPYRRIIMELYGSTVNASPSDKTNAGRSVLEKDPNHPGSLGIAISEAIEVAATNENTKYSLGSVLNHVLMHQTVVGQEALLQFDKIDVKPDVMIGCVGGGSNFGGFIFPALGRRLRGEDNSTRFLAVEPVGCPTLTKGEYRYDFGDTAMTTPLLMMYTLGHDFVPSPIHAGGLRYHGDAPTVSLLHKTGDIDAVAYDQLSTFEAGRLFTKTEGLVPAPETCHAVKAAIDEALDAKKKGEERVIAFNLSGHGLLDLKGYADFLAGRLK
ncbi:MAG: TrpB-like pyridoxal phosphate-dependent enzyme [Methanobacteriota archaeon]|nr:MAG: TrpB-like pyridoxal phosphate-dependent enzyme [Euryarchaeota archaeon]